MPSHAELASRLLLDAAQFFKTIGEQNEALKPQMEENATVFEQISQLVGQNPAAQVAEAQGQPDAPTHAELAGRLLGDAAGFFRTIGEQNPALKDQMADNATVFEQVSTLVTNDPTGMIDENAGAPPAG